MREKIDKIIKEYGYKSIIYLIFFPILILPLNVFALIGSVINIIKALNRYNWKYLSGHTPLNALNNYFYYIQDLNIQRFGRYGVSNLLAGGRFNLKTWFHATPVSLRFQSTFGTIFMTFFAMCIWIVNWFFIMDYNITNFAILFISIFSTYFIINFIYGQNYNVLAWMFLPIAFFALVEKNFLLFSAVAFLMSFFSFTSIFILGVVAFVFSIYFQNFDFLMALFPALIKVFIPIWRSLEKDALKKVRRVIGLFDKDAKYKRNNKKINFIYIYFTFLISIFLMNYYVRFGIDSYFILQITIAFLYIMNVTFSRFADNITLFISILTVFTISMINKELDFTDIFIFLISINPLFLFLGYKSNTLISPDIIRIVNTRSLIEDMINFLKNIGENQKIWFAFYDPKNDYGKIFSPYRQLLEPLQYCANKLNLVLFPDWYYVMDHNDPNEKDYIWINKEQNIEINLKKLEVNYFIMFQDSNIKIRENIFKEYKLLDKIIVENFYKDNIQLYLFKVKQ